jgi:murein DD-endopeptidase MepM/ murein hydrolase activator NlpD
VRWRLVIAKIMLVVIVIIGGVLVFSLIASPVTKNIDPYVYDLPFEKGTKHRIVQGYGGLFSHRNIAALDFNMPEGTPVCAAREGIIYSFKDDSDEGGPFPGYEKKANYIIIKHSDGSFACYWHLKKNGVLIKSGAVAKGQVIGYSGATGFVLKAHLHFSVKKILSYDKDAYVKTTFRTSNGIEFLENDEVYEKPVR